MICKWPTGRESSGSRTVGRFVFQYMAPVKRREIEKELAAFHLSFQIFPLATGVLPSK